jgi:predicted transcriptional regulator
MEDAWLESVKKPDGTDYLVFSRRTLTTWKRWVGGEFEFDGVGLRDVVNANAVYLDGVKRDLDDHRENMGVAFNSVDSRLDALEAASTSSFP